MKRILRAVAVALIVCLCACSLAGARELSGKYVQKIQAIRLNKTRFASYVGLTFTLTAAVAPTSRSSVPVAWSSSDEEIATVDTSGKVTLRKEGQAVITATAIDEFANLNPITGSEVVPAYDYGEPVQITNSCTVIVKTAPVKAFALNMSAAKLKTGDTIQAEATKFAPAYATDKTLVWTSRNDLIASVAQDGLITAKAPGKTQIVARSASGKQRVITVAVTDSEILPSKVRLSATKLILSKEQTQALTATVYPLNVKPENRIITWKSSKPNIVSVDATGQLTALANGTALIRAQSVNGKYAVARVKVTTIRVTALTLDQTQLVLSTEDSPATLTATVKPANATLKTVLWTSSNTAVATVANGVVTPLKAGLTTIVARCGTKAASCTVRVRGAKQAEVVITVGGDITIGGDPRVKGSLMKSDDYYDQLYALKAGQFLKGVTPYTAGRDNELTMVNLESTLTNSTRISGGTRWYVFRGKPEYAQILADGGIDVIGHANNHSKDFGTTGMRDTKTSVEAKGVGYAAFNVPYTKEIIQNGVTVRVAFLACTDINKANILRMIKSYKSQGYLVVLSVHFGTMGASYNAGAKAMSVARAAVNAGADLVFGHHTHLVSGIEKYKGKYICYGTGTLSSAILTPTDMDTFLFQQTFLVDETGLVEEKKDGVRVIPLSMGTEYRAIDPKANDAAPVPLSGNEAQRVWTKIKYLSRKFAQSAPDSAYSYVS